MIVAESLVKEFSRPPRIEGRFAGIRSFLSTEKIVSRAHLLPNVTQEINMMESTRQQ